MLTVSELIVNYGPISALQGLDLHVDAGETVGVVGPNGAGKSTLMNAISGITSAAAGSIHLEGATLDGVAPERIVRRGVALVPEARHIFGGLTVEENLRLGATIRRDKTGIDDDIETHLTSFPNLRRYYRSSAGALSGGEQQMLAIARALMSRPRLLLLDEPSLGLAPVVVDQVFASLADIKAQGTTMLLVEQNASRTLAIADRIYAINHGVVQFSGNADELRDDPQFEAIYLGGL